MLYHNNSSYVYYNFIQNLTWNVNWSRDTPSLQLIFVADINQKEIWAFLNKSFQFLIGDFSWNINLI